MGEVRTTLGATGILAVAIILVQAACSRPEPTPDANTTMAVDTIPGDCFEEYEGTVQEIPCEATNANP